MAVSLGVGAVWVVLAHACRAGHSYLLGKTLGENSDASWWKTTGDDGLIEVQGGLFGLLNVFTHVDCEPCYIRGPCRDTVAAIFGWATACAGTIDLC